MQYAWLVWPCQLELGVATSHNWNPVQNPDSSLIMHDFDLTDELSLKIELHMLRPITEKVHSGNGRVSLVLRDLGPLNFTMNLYCRWIEYVSMQTARANR